ncbi:MAG: hypothetical protein IT285_07050 [Bdellovibrionales bacterium]|nr:hypothetical protein [Bdellovibrionales bacterium]
MAHIRCFFVVVLTAGAALFPATPLAAEPLGSAPGAPGMAFTWAPACKQAIGTAYEPSSAAGVPRSPLWFTMAEGVVTEIFYPTIDQPQVGDLQFVVTGPGGFFSEQRQDTTSRVEYLDGMVVRVSGADRRGRYRFDQTVTADPARPVLRVRTRFIGLPAEHRVFVLFKPALHNGGSKDLGRARRHELSVSQTEGVVRQPVGAALVPSRPFLAASAGYSGSSDGWQLLKQHGHLASQFGEAGPGNIALAGEAALDAGPEFEVALGFARDEAAAASAARASLESSFDAVASAYARGWNGFTAGTLPESLRADALAALSSRILRIHVDKSRPGAMAAALNKPGIPYTERAGEGNYGGYHLVWPRDLYHSAMALLAGGDSAAVEETLDFFRSTQKPDGSWWQNQWVDGTPYWKAVQMDQVAFPILLTWHATRRIRPATGAELQMVRKAAEFLKTRGPWTEQDRWEEIGGFVPSAIAAEMAGLRAASRLLGDPQYNELANRWSGLLEHWTFRRQGPLGRDYFLRVSPSGNAQLDELFGLANGMGQALSSEIIDGGFLELVRLGLRRPDAGSILSTLAVYEDPRSDVASDWLPQHGGARAYRRYNRDGYGHRNRGGYWPLLAGERGHYALAAGDLPRALAQLAVMRASTLGSGHLPEQTHQAPGGSPGQASVGAGVPCPLAWSHGEYLLLARSLADGKVFDAP